MHLSDKAEGEVTVGLIPCPPEEFEVVADGKGIGPQVSPGTGGYGVKTCFPGKVLHDLPDLSGCGYVTHDLSIPGSESACRAASGP